ncbi:histidinol-phosphate transaminase [Beggiatoa leptomitoformis]|uniref:Histidinol-phosphate aminotransferase n=1 Tax=Beggiatoa leptomitoformis TaxID=288004 RepID=A0A2N9YET8_9GAMM|nr:histidinol-phosphate transaminase [Beggiatoa leptomitoformis]ALG68658.1 histidinol-phosphate transaminase [Beggiatoa leptomitoformis]AUI68990.1 histidinol-phosphate transaminase [Beggiatoa leptomitoformis]
MTNSSVVADWIRPEIRELNAYHVPPAHGMIKLDAMENPYRWDATLVEQWLNVLREAELNRYPDPAASSVKGGLRRVMQIPDELDILLGNGSDEIIQLLVMAVSGQNRVLLAPEPSFVMYRMIATFINMRYVGIPLHATDFSIELDAWLQAIATHQPALTFIAYPNNPTGNAFSQHDIEKIIQATKGLVIIDEAYEPFAEHSLLSLVNRYPNVLLMRTLSKLGLAGLRLGMLIGAPAWLNEIDKVRLPYNINVLTQLSTEFALQHYKTLKAQTEQIKRDRAQLLADLRTLKNLHVWDSQANFILFRVPHAKAVFEHLKQQGVLIKCLDGGHPLLANCLRVTVGTATENQAFLAGLRMALTA